MNESDNIKFVSFVCFLSCWLIYILNRTQSLRRSHFPLEIRMYDRIINIHRICPILGPSIPSSKEELKMFSLISSRSLDFRGSRLGIWCVTLYTFYVVGPGIQSAFHSMPSIPLAASRSLIVLLSNLLNFFLVQLLDVVAGQLGISPDPQPGLHANSISNHDSNSWRCYFAAQLDLDNG